MTHDTDKTKAELIAELETLRALHDEDDAHTPSVCAEGDKFRQMVDGLPQIVYEIDLEGKLTYANALAFESFGYTWDDINSGLNIQQIIHPDDLELAMQNIGKSLAGEGPIAEKYTGVRKDGSLLPIQIYSQGVFEDGQPRGVRGIVIDISDIKQAEQALKKSESYYRTLFETTGTAMAIFGDDGVITSCNSQFALLSGYSREEIENAMTWMHFTVAEDVERIEQHHKIHDLEDASISRLYDATFIPREEAHKHIQISVKLIPGTDKRVCSLIDISDIREAEKALRKSENYYRTLFENTGTAMCIFGNDSIIRSCNSQFDILSGYPHEKIVGLMKWSDMVDPEDLKRITAYHTKRLSEGHDAPNSYEFTFLARDEVRKRVHVFIQIIPETEERVCSLIDVTDRQQAEEKLRASEERYGLVVRGANDGIWDWNLQTDEVYYSPRYKAILGYEDHEFPNVAASWIDNVHPNDLDHTIGINTQCIEGKVDSFIVEYRMRHKDGSYRWILGRGASVKDENGAVYRMAGTHTDITDRKKAEERYREIIENASDGIYQSTPEGSFITANTAMARHMGYDSAEEIINAVDDIENQMWVDPNGRDVFLRELTKKGFLDNFQVQLYQRDGSKIWVSENIRAIYNKKGELDYYEGFLQNITERKLHERTTNALYAISKAISTTRDLQHLYENIHAILGQVIDATNFFIALLDEEEDRLFFPYFADERDDYYDIRDVSSPATKSLAVHILRTGKPLFITGRATDSAEIQFNMGVVGSPAAVWLGVPLKLNGKIIGAMAVQHYTNPHHYTDSDVTLMEAVSEQVALAIERKANEEELTSLNEELENKVAKRTVELQDKASELEIANKRLTELDEIKSTLVSSVSHELRTPLTSIRGFAKLTGKDFLRFFHPLANQPALEKKGERIRKNLEIIESEGERLTRLINDFLDINRIESGKASWNDTFLNPCEVINQAVAALTGAFAAKSEVHLLADLPTTIPPIHADPDKIQQVLINLLNNACKFTLEGSVVVSTAMDKDMLVITVTDTGIGIAKEELGRVFEKFHKSRTGDTVSITDKGTGLGLAISREIVEHYGGTIWVESEYGIGSTFCFTLPTISGTETACS